MHLPLKVLVTTSVLPRWPGDATPPFVLNLCDDLAEAGCEITLLAPHSPGSAFHEKRNALTIRRYPYFWPLRFQSLLYEGGMIVRLRENRARYLLLPFLFAAQFAAMQRMQTERFDLIHAHSLLPQGWISGLANLKHLPLVISSHGADVFLLSTKWKAFLHSAIRSAHALIANSSATSRRLYDLGAVPGQVHRIPATPNYPDPDRITHQPPGRPVLLFAGRVIHEKGVDALVEAMPAIRSRFPDCSLRIAGSGNLEEALKKRVQELGIENSVTFLGWLGPADLRREMRHATLLVAPSRMIEGQNLVVTEALSVGCPVATTPRGGVLDLVRDRKTGFIIPESETRAVAGFILKLLSSPKCFDRVRTNGFNHFMDNYSRKRITKLTTEFYREVCCGSF